MRYVSALEELFDQITLDLIAARGELVRRAPARGEDEPDADNPVVLFGQPIETMRSAPAINRDALMTPEVLRRLFGSTLQWGCGQQPPRWPSSLPRPYSPSTSSS